MGRIDPGETPAEAAAREVEEETGWHPGPLRELAIVQPSSGIMDAAHYIHAADGATHTGAPRDGFEATRIEWVPLADVPELIAKREISSSSTITALLLSLHGKPPVFRALVSRAPTSQAVTRSLAGLGGPLHLARGVHPLTSPGQRRYNPPNCRQSKGRAERARSERDRGDRDRLRRRSEAQPSPQRLNVAANWRLPVPSSR